jgi:hypothetical protein
MGARVGWVQAWRRRLNGTRTGRASAIGIMRRLDTGKRTGPTGGWPGDRVKSSPRLLDLDVLVDFRFQEGPRYGTDDRIHVLPVFEE